MGNQRPTRDLTLRRLVGGLSIMMAAAFLSACSTSATTGAAGAQPPKVAMKSSLGKGEGQLRPLQRTHS